MRATYGTAIVLAIVACDAPTPAAPTPTAPIVAVRADAGVPAADAPAPCVPWKEGYGLASATARGSALDICFEKICDDHDTYDRDPTCRDRACWSFDLASKAWSFVGRRQPEQPAPESEATHVVRADGAYAADWDVDAVRVTDRAGKLVHTLKAWMPPGGMGGIQTVQFLDDTLAIFVGHGAETEEARLFDPQTGKQLGAIAPRNGIYEPTALGDHLFAFFEVPAIQMLVVDVSTGKLVRHVAIQPDQNPGWTPQLVLPMPDHSIEIVVDNLVVRVDPSGAVTRFPAPACPAAPTR